MPRLGRTLVVSLLAIRYVTIEEAVAWIPCAGGYVVAVEEGVLRCLTAGEEAVFQVISHGTEIPPARPVGRSTSDTPALRSEGEPLPEIVSRVMSEYRLVRGERTLKSILVPSIWRMCNVQATTAVPNVQATTSKTPRLHESRLWTGKLPQPYEIPRTCKLKRNMWQQSLTMWTGASI
jgi:hypothetical protein